jgi:glycosyltransferase involved in cell wall biosynthesis
MKRVMMMVRELGPGGTERQLTELAKALDRSRFEVHVGFFREGPRADELRKAGIRLVPFAVESFVSPGVIRGALALRRYLRAQPIDIVHTFDSPLNSFGVPVARLAGTRAVLSSQRAHRSLNSKMRWKLLRATDRMVDAIVVNCESMRRHLMEQEGIDAARIRLCYNGIDTERFHPAPRTRPQELREASAIVGVVCVLRPEKDLITLQKAFALVAASHPGLRLVIVGSGPERDRLLENARELGIEAQSHFVPATADVTSWLHAIDIFVLPSLSEALSNSLMEAMGCGCAVIASDTGGNPELVEHGKTGLIFRPGDAEDLARQIESLVESEPCRRRLADAAAARIRESFSVESSALRMAEIYEEFAPDS